MEVIRTFFEEESKCPCFELEDGTILKPYYTYNGDVRWMTEDDFKLQKIERDKKEQSFFKRLLSHV